MVTKEQVTRAIADVAGRDWQANGPRSEGYSIILAKQGGYFCLSSLLADRLRLRLNTIDRICNTDGHRPLLMWIVKDYPAGIELRYIHEPENDGDRERLRQHPDTPRYEISIPDDDALTFAAYIYLLRYGNEALPPSDDDNQHYGNEGQLVRDLVDDFATDTRSLYLDGQQLYDHIAHVGCQQCVEALDATVQAYRDYCAAHGYEAEPIDTWGNREDDEEE